MIKVGAILPLTGNLSLLGQEVKNGILLAVEDVNSNNQTKLEVVFEDSIMDAKEGVTAINKLKDIDGIKDVIVWGTPVISAVQPITEENKMILMAGSISPSILEDKNYTFRLFYNLGQALDKFTDFIKEKQFSKVIAFYQNGEAWEQQIQGLESQGVNFIAKEKFEMGEKDFRTMLFKIKNNNPDLIVLLGYGSHFPILFKQIEGVGMKEIPILGGLDFLEVPKENLDLYNQAVFVVPDFNVKPSSKSLSFIENFEKKFNSTPTHQAAYAYDITSLLYDAMIKSKGDSNIAVELLKATQEFEGVVGRVEILPDGGSKGSLSFAHYKNNEVVLYEEE